MTLAKPVYKPKTDVAARGLEVWESTWCALCEGLLGFAHGRRAVCWGSVGCSATIQGLGVTSGRLWVSCPCAFSVLRECLLHLFDCAISNGAGGAL